MVRLTLFVACFLPLLLWLGIWQLDRAAYKEQLQERYLDRVGALPTNPSADQLAQAALDPAGLAFLRVGLRGNFMTGRHFLVDNQVLAGQVGYWVITPFSDVQQRIWLVNRGWIAASSQRQELPPVPDVLGEVKIVGLIWPFTGLVPLFGDQLSEPVSNTEATAQQSPWPKRVQRLDLVGLAEMLKADTSTSVLTHEVRLEPGSKGALGAVPQVLVGAGDVHRGYAATWFGLAMVLTCGYVIFVLRQRREN